jgi:hypothetical protein
LIYISIEFMFALRNVFPGNDRQVLTNTGAKEYSSHRLGKPSCCSDKATCRMTEVSESDTWNGTFLYSETSKPALGAHLTSLEWIPVFIPVGKAAGT